MSFAPETVAAFVDGELDDVTARRVEREAAGDPALAAQIARHRALKRQLTAHYAPIAEEVVPDRLRALLVGDAKVDSSLTDRREAKRGRFAAMQWGAMAASLALGLTLGLRPWMPAADVTAENGRLVAAGSLADALDSQLASSQPGDARVRIGLSFRDRQGRYCRSFESTVVDGISCREDGRWALERTLRGQAPSEYRQASSGALASAVAEMTDGEPFDAAAERAARDAGWNR